MAIEHIGISQNHSVQMLKNSAPNFKGHITAKKSEEEGDSFSKSDNKKKIAKFAALGAVATGAIVGAIYLAKSGKAKKALDSIKEFFNTNKNKAKETANGAKPPKATPAKDEAIEAAKNAAKEAEKRQAAIKQEAVSRLEAQKAAERSAELSQDAYKAVFEKNLSNKSAEESAKVFEEAFSKQEAQALNHTPEINSTNVVKKAQTTIQGAVEGIKGQIKKITDRGNIEERVSYITFDPNEIVQEDTVAAFKKLSPKTVEALPDYVIRKASTETESKNVVIQSIEQLENAFTPEDIKKSTQHQSGRAMLFEWLKIPDTSAADKCWLMEAIKTL